MKEHAFPLFHPNGLAMSQHPTIDREVPIPHLIAVWHPLRKRCFHRRLASRFEFFYSRCWGQKILRHVAALTKRRFEFLEDEKDFSVIAPWLMFRLYIYRPDLTAVLSPMKISTCPIVRVIETETGWTRSERNPAHSARRDERCPFLGSSVHVCGDHLAMPVQLLGSVGVVVHFDRRWLTIFETQKGPWKLTDVRNCRDDVFGSDLNRT